VGLVRLEAPAAPALVPEMDVQGNGISISSGQVRSRPPEKGLDLRGQRSGRFAAGRMARVWNPQVLGMGKCVLQSSPIIERLRARL